ncbi:MAG TPA: nucleoside monophosphate kinase [Candidatus Saccharimonadales bacterium]|nr:nucleoside monophosphate kinase [Candidatus Saccharimonadales bacterium]
MFGAQGSGKSTQAQTLADRLNLPLYIQGDQVRAFLKSGAPEAAAVQEQVDRGDLIDETVIERLFNEYLDSHDCSRGIVIDGLPRMLEQCHVITQVQKRFGWQCVAVYIRISDQTAEERIAKRVVVVDGHETTRSDDTKEALAKRLATFKRETLPVLDWFEDNYRLVVIDGEPEPEMVWGLISSALGLNV